MLTGSWERGLSRGRTSARSRPPPSTENPKNDARIYHNGWPCAARVGAAGAPFHGIARLVPFWGVGLGFVRRADGNDGLNALPHPLRAQGVDIIGAGLGVVGARAARHAQAQETALSIRQDVALSTEAAPIATEGGIRHLFFGGHARHAHDRAGTPLRGRGSLTS